MESNILLKLTTTLNERDQEFIILISTQSIIIQKTTGSGAIC